MSTNRITMVRLVALCLIALGAMEARAQPAALAVGSMLPNQEHTVQLLDGSSGAVSSLLAANGTIFIFWSNQCRWTEGYEARVKALYAAASSQGMSVVLVNSNDPEAFPKESLDASASKGYRMPYVHDPGGILARALGAYRTPEVFAFDGEGILVYAGAIDDAPADAKAVGTSYVSDFLAGLRPAPTKAFGCRIRLPSG